MKVFCVVLVTLAAVALGYPNRDKRGIEEFQQKDIYIPVIGKDGVPLDTPEVQKAKERHYYALIKAKAREHNPHHQEEEQEPAEYPPADPHNPHAYVPALSKTGEPINTPEVQFARKQHLTAVEVAKERQEKAHLEESFAPKHEEEISYEQHIDYYPQEGQGGYEYITYEQEKY